MSVQPVRKFGFCKRSDRIKTDDGIVSSEDIVKAVSTRYFRPYQMDMWNEVVKSYNMDVEYDACQFASGTGTGKTEIFKFIPPYFMARRKEAGIKDGMVFALVCHRIGLIKDLSKRILPTITNKFVLDDRKNWFVDEKNPAGCGLSKDKIKYYFVNSDGRVLAKCQDESAESRMDDLNQIANKRIPGNHVMKYTKAELEKEIEENKKKGIHSMFICLYQSLGEYGNTTMKDIFFDLCICDEIHELNVLGEKTFFNCLKVFERSKRNYFFSATLQMDPKDERYGEDFQKADNNETEIM